MAPRRKTIRSQQCSAKSGCVKTRGSFPKDSGEKADHHEVVDNAFKNVWMAHIKIGPRPCLELLAEPNHQAHKEPGAMIEENPDWRSPIPAGQASDVADQ